ncbi:MAG: hypothetical protein R2939_16165 [Kofleriaceae bacterium]
MAAAPAVVELPLRDHRDGGVVVVEPDREVWTLHAEVDRERDRRVRRAAGELGLGRGGAATRGQRRLLAAAGAGVGDQRLEGRRRRWRHARGRQPDLGVERQVGEQVHRARRGVALAPEVAHHLVEGLELGLGPRHRVAGGLAARVEQLADAQRLLEQRPRAPQHVDHRRRLGVAVVGGAQRAGELARGDGVLGPARGGAGGRELTPDADRPGVQRLADPHRRGQAQRQRQLEVGREPRLAEELVEAGVSRVDEVAEIERVAEGVGVAGVEADGRPVAAAGRGSLGLGGRAGQRPGHQLGVAREGAGHVAGEDRIVGVARAWRRGAGRGADRDHGEGSDDGGGGAHEAPGETLVNS